eukprot:12180273-Ditylum_brightwellii.AAC.1
MAKQQQLALATLSGKCHSLTTVRNGQSPQTSNNGIDLENIKHGLCALAADITDCTKEIAMHCTTKIAKKTEEVVNPMDLHNIEMTNNNNDIDTKMADDTTTAFSLQSTNQNNKDEWMDAGNKDINWIKIKLDYKDKSKEKNQPSEIKSSLQQSLVTKGNNNNANFVSAASSTHKAIAHVVVFSLPDKEDEVEDKYKSTGKFIQEKGAEAIDAMTIVVTLVKLESTVAMNMKVFLLRQEVVKLLKAT